MGKSLVKSKVLHQQQDRVLTSHVQTRLYRAPEVLLLEKHYYTPIDVWSSGVILGELFKVLENRALREFDDGYHLFKGKHSFPLSPPQNTVFEGDGLPNTRGDLLKSILSLLGSPDKYDQSFVTDESAQMYLNKFRKTEPTQLNLKFTSVSTAGLDLLRQMLTFNPYLRPDIESCLSHPYFDCIRERQFEMLSPLQISMEFEKF